MQLPTIDPYLLLWIEWSVASMLGLVTGFIVLKYADLAPDFMHRIVKYGKTAERYDKYHIVELPKRYFNHFYSVALVFYTFLATVAFDMYFNLNLFGDNAHESPSIFVRVLELFNKNEYLTPLGGHLRTAACKFCITVTCEASIKRNFRPLTTLFAHNQHRRARVSHDRLDAAHHASVEATLRMHNDQRVLEWKHEHCALYDGPLLLHRRRSKHAS